MEQTYLGLSLGRWTVIGTIAVIVLGVRGILVGKSHKQQIIGGNKAITSGDNINHGINMGTIGHQVHLHTKDDHGI